jgi:hypothetical protein
VLNPCNDGIHDPRRAIHDVQRRMKAMLLLLARRDVHRIFVRHPAGVHRVHVDAVGVIIRRRGARHHVQRRLGHVGVRMARGLELAVELTLPPPRR